jgi:O-acetylserine/cysteine efflux transporter
MGTVPPLLFAAIRFSVVSLACFFVPRPPVPFRIVAAVGAFMSLGQFGFLYLALHLGMGPGLAALVLQSQAVFTIVIASAALREWPTRAQVTGTALGVAGLFVVAFGLGGQVPLAALGLCLLAGLSWGAGNVVSRAAHAPGGLAITVWSATVAPLPLLGLSLLIDGPAAVGHGLAHLGWHGAASTLYTAGLCSLVGYALFNRLLSRYPAASVVPWVLLAPVVALASSWALLGEAPGPAELAGAALLVLGVLVAQGIIRRPSQREEIQILPLERTRDSASTADSSPAAASRTPPSPSRRSGAKSHGCRDRPLKTLSTAFRGP